MAKKSVERKNMTQVVDGKVTREPTDDGNGSGVFFWWKKFTEEDESERQDDALANEVISTIRFIQKNQSSRIDQLTVSTRLYGNNSAYNLIGAAFSRASSASSTPAATRISFNLCASIVDTLTAQTAKNKVVPTFITSGGIWGMQRKAEKLSKFTEGLFYENNAHEKITYQARDAGVWGDGIIQPYRNSKDRVSFRRVYPHELFFDLIEQLKGNPRQVHRVYLEDRGILLDEHPDKAEMIERCSPASYQDIGGVGTAADLVLVSESWHLRSGEKATDGVWVKTLMDSGQTLKKGDYDKDYFPFAILPYSKRLIGEWGQGACERLQNIQGEINRTMITIQKCHWLFAGTKVYLPIGSKIVSQHINNELASIIHGNEPPQYLTPPMVQDKMYEWTDKLIAMGYQQEGISQLSASNVKPMGINSGTALRTYDTISEDRQLFFGQRVEGAALELTRQSIEIVKDIFKEKGKYEIQYPNTNFIESIDWKDINLSMDEYWLKAFPTSELPEEPAAKLETVQEYMQAGLISPRAGRRLLSMPDVEMSDKLANAAEELICKSIEEILYDGKKSIRPDGEWDLQLAKTLSLQYMNFAKLNNCPEKRLQLLRDFMAYIDDEMGLTVPPQPPPGANGMPAPQANPMPTPISNMVPNVAGAA